MDVSLNLLPPNSTDLLQSAINLLTSISLEGTSDFVISALNDQINIANQLLLCNNNLNSTECTTAQIASCDSLSSSCSNQGECTQLWCVCNQGYYLKGCSLSQTDYDLQTQLRETLINSAVTSMNTQNILEMMSMINALTQEPYLNSNSTLNMTLKAVTQAIQVLNSSSSNNPNISNEIQAIADVISNNFDQITTASTIIFRFKHLIDLMTNCNSY